MRLWVRWLVFNAIAIVSAHGVCAELPSAAPGRDYARSPSADWPMLNGDQSNMRFSGLARINKSNVSELGLAWVSENFGDGATSQSPVVVNDGLLFVTAGQYVHALDAKFGERVWSYKSPAGKDSTGLFRSGNLGLVNLSKGVPNNGGVRIGQGLVFVGLVGGTVVALREKTGKLVWTRHPGTHESNKGHWTAGSLTYSSGILFTGLADDAENRRGKLTALDAMTGRQLWQRFSIPGPGEPGHETWPSFNDGWRFGGGGISASPAVDPELGLVYFTAGDPAPAYGGDLRPGDNLYSGSVLAVEVKTGKLKWYYQFVRHDVFGAASGAPILLYDAQVDGSARKALAVMRGDGHVFQLDRVTGKPLAPIEERAVPQLPSQSTAKTQPFPMVGESILKSCEDWQKEPVPAGFVLGCMFTPPASPPPSTDPQNVLAPAAMATGSAMAYSPQTGYFYAYGTSILHWPRRSQDPYFRKEVGAIPGLQTYGEFAALDSRTGKIVWRRRVPVGATTVEPLTTAGELVFRSSGDGRLEASDAGSGQILWDFQAGSSGGPVVTYELDGEQYLAATLGTAVWAFKRGGKPIERPKPVVSRSEEALPGPLVDTAEIETSSAHRSETARGTRYFIDEFTFNPVRARVKVGSKLLFVNNGILHHEIVALDNSWSTGRLSPGEEAWLTFGNPGEHLYVCKEHPWSYGQLIVRSDDLISRSHEKPMESDTESASRDFSDRARRGREHFERNCSVCHGEDLAGRGAAPALLGEAFMLRWTNVSVADLFDNIRSTMPLANPGSLSRETYLDIAAYLLRTNGISLQGELKDDAQHLRSIKMKASTTRN
ncbi:PQQ-binding-like beta-propeller repeat protein [Steroidobacter sp. S1-65]|uniref:PQQ-binding-like beta-propeller repeat protein n=1 Tax=Steroidobacter gossypii TaxID=2805490 RepID=A0ABS1X6R3_9GAMM|nr:PQQ-binding-like beta-propeller repeat protein [Steroidobacter gossypii]MBM0108918.1 PQQ-binding-like beta-propeller repeat protein [Steroidobacter gossypii]